MQIQKYSRTEFLVNFTATKEEIDEIAVDGFSFYGCHVDGETELGFWVNNSTNELYIINPEIVLDLVREDENAEFEILASIQSVLVEKIVGKYSWSENKFIEVETLYDKEIRVDKELEYVKKRGKMITLFDIIFISICLVFTIAVFIVLKMNGQ